MTLAQPKMGQPPGPQERRSGFTGMSMKHVREMLLNLESLFAQHRPGKRQPFECHVQMRRVTCRRFENACEVRGAHVHQHCKLLDRNSFGYVRMNEDLNASQHLTRKWRIRPGPSSTAPVAQSDVDRDDIGKSVGAGGVDEPRALQSTQCIDRLA